MTDELLTIRKEKKYDEIINELDEVLVKYNLTYVECYGVIKLLEKQVEEEQEKEE